MIVLGRRKLGRFQKLISAASVSSYVLSHADCTVVICKE
jgi:nucleotide-binding universal stress UspA family protein